MFSEYAACEGLVWMANSTTNRVVGKGTVQFRMVDEEVSDIDQGKSCSISMKIFNFHWDARFEGLQLCN